MKEQDCTLHRAPCLAVFLAKKQPTCVCHQDAPNKREWGLSKEMLCRQNNRLCFDNAGRCFTARTRGYGNYVHLLIDSKDKRQCSLARVWLSYENNGLLGWARPIWLFLSCKLYRKSTPGGRWSIPLQAKPAHNIPLCTDSNGKQASKTSTAEAFPLPPFCYALPVLLFLAFCIARTGRAFNRIAYEHKKQSGAKAKQA